MTRSHFFGGFKAARSKDRLRTGSLSAGLMIRRFAVALSVLILLGCGAEEEVTAPPPPTTEPAPPAEPVPEPEPEPRVDTSEMRVPDDAEIWARDYTGLLRGLNGSLYAGYHPVTVRRIQESLGQSGFYSGSVDGIFDRETMEAIADFQAQNDLPITGIPTPMTRLKIFAESS